MRKTHALVQVAATLMADPDEKHWGYNTSKKAGVRPAVLYPIFDRMLTDGWLSDGWEESAAGKKRPPRRYYEITEQGRAALAALLLQASRDPRFARLDLNHDEKLTKG
jgi:PadR family transcriptional regulator PadR